MIPPHQQRVLDERRELFAKFEKLQAFLSGTMIQSLAEDEQERLIRQCVIMADYLGVLDERIAAFGAVGAGK